MKTEHWTDKELFYIGSTRQPGQVRIEVNKFIRNNKNLKVLDVKIVRDEEYLDLFAWAVRKQNEKGIGEV